MLLSAKRFCLVPAVFTIVVLSHCITASSVQAWFNPENYEPNRAFETKVNKVNSQCLPPEIKEIYSAHSMQLEQELEDWYNGAGDSAAYAYQVSQELIID